MTKILDESDARVSRAAGIFEIALIGLLAQGPTVYELVRATYRCDRDSPRRWLILLVGRDAVARGLGRCLVLTLL